MEEFGPAEEHVGRSSDWPSGIEEVLRHPSRAYWQWVNGSERAYFDGDLQAVNELLALYSKIDIAEHTVVILPGKRTATSFDRRLTPYVVEFDVPGKIEIAARQRDGSGALHAKVPTLVLALDATFAERLDELKIPQNVSLQVSRVTTAKYESCDPALRRKLAEFVANHAERAGEDGDKSAK